MQAPIYLDYAATTPVAPEVVQSMSGYLGPDGCFANPSSAHRPGRAAAAQVEVARRQVASLINADPAGVIWTSGATEANNLAILGAARFARGRNRGGHVITSRVEHPAVLAACAALEREGAEVTYLAPGPGGAIAPEAVAEALRPDTALVSLMYVNNETGAINPLERIAPLVRAQGALLHVDAVQAAGRLPIDVAQLGADLLSLSAHKFYGPKGIGVLYRRPRPMLRLEPLIHGGGQEQGLRSGTLAVHQIVGMGEAARLAAAALGEEPARLQGLRRRLCRGLEALDAVRVNSPEHSAPHVLNISIGCVQGEALAEALDPVLAASAGSACSAASARPSHVLRALGLPDALAHSTLRLSLGRYTTEQEIDGAVEIIGSAVRRLREFSPLWRDFRRGRPLEALYAGAGSDA